MKEQLTLQPRPEHLTAKEERDLERIESVIAAKLAAFFEVGFALIEIKTRKLYRAEFRTFEEYCHQRWEFKRSYAYRLIGAAEVCKELSPIGDIPLPENECQIRPLAGLSSATVRKAWKRACEAAGLNGKVTGALVQKAVIEVSAKRKIKEPQHFRANWQVHVENLLEEALLFTRKGNQEAVADILYRASLQLIVGRNTGATETINLGTLRKDEL